MGKPALRLLCDQLYEPFDVKYHVDAYDILSRLVCKGAPIAEKTDALFALSNLLAEPGMSATFVTDAATVTAVCKYANDGKTHATDALWILANALNTASCLTDVEEDVLGLLDNTVFKAFSKVSSDGELYTALQDASSMLSLEWMRRQDMVDEENAALLAEQLDIEEEEWKTTTDAEASAAARQAMKEVAGFMSFHDEPKEAMPPASGNCFPPTALDLLMGAAAYTGTSRTVYNLIRSVEANNFDFTAVSEDLVLTVADLRTLELRGFVITCGYVGINPLLSISFS